MESVYLETTFIRYLVARPSRDLLVAAHQQTTHQWWNDRREGLQCYVSQVVIDEASAGDAEEAKKRMQIIDDLAVFEVTEEVESLARAILASGALPPRGVRDAARVAVAAIHDVDYLLTWNCKHLANAQIMRRISVVCNSHQYGMPLICTPEELMGE